MAAKRSQSLLRAGPAHIMRQQTKPSPATLYTQRACQGFYLTQARRVPGRLRTTQAGHQPARIGRWNIRLYSTESSSNQNPIVHPLFEAKTGSWQYVVVDSTTSTAVIIDPVLDYDPITQAVTTKSADDLLATIEDQGLKIDGILETHAHADHLTAASYLKRQLGEVQGQAPLICIGSRIDQVQQRFSSRYSVPATEYTAVFDKLFDDDEDFMIGSIKATAMHVPGHTPDHMGYKIGGSWLLRDCFVP